ncbi:MAG: terminase small subunit [Nitrospinae bacterium]|nr:terminase small subunit [Nitrospinota bacterium]
MELTPKRQRFIEEYPVDLNATQAAIRAGFSRKTAASAGQRLLRNVEISESVTERLLKLSAETNNTYERRVEVAEECLRLAREQGDYKGMLSANDQLIELGGYYRKSVEVKGDLTVNVPMSETKKFIASALAKIRDAGRMDTTK